jgi:hypothetical protein
MTHFLVGGGGGDMVLIYEEEIADDRTKRNLIQVTLKEK